MRFICTARLAVETQWNAEKKNNGQNQTISPRFEHFERVGKYCRGKALLENEGGRFSWRDVSFENVGQNLNTFIRPCGFMAPLDYCTCGLFCRAKLSLRSAIWWFSAPNKNEPLSLQKIVEKLKRKLFV